MISTLNLISKLGFGFKHEFVFQLWFLSNLLFFPILATVHFTHDAKQSHSIANDLMANSEKTKIFEYYENLFDYIGSNVLLPCKATAKAEIYWINDAGKLISGQEPR